MSTPPVRINIDGGARGNPGPAAYGFVIHRDGQTVEDAGQLGRATNNVAEYTALVEALQRAAELGIPRLHIRSDSELLVKQMNGEYRVKNADLQDLYREAMSLRRGFESVTLEHVRRADNSRADELVNLALDGQWRPAAAPCVKTPSPSAAPSKTPPVDPLRAEAVACLSAAARAWSRGDPADPPPEQVWGKLRAILDSQRSSRDA